ncbi:MAG: envelope stress response membrane protein PspC [Alphaproteobacteria bacterium]|nr:MAG: envelope stress response membrane protein PspC [Alphaproteobacteria bacterium]
MTRYSPNKLYKDPDNGKIMGVCAGLADYTGIKANVIRCVLVIGCLFGWFLPLVPVYFILGFVLDPKPKGLYRDAEEERFWRDVRIRPDYTAVDMKRRFRAIDRRLQGLESYITSKRFGLDRDLRNLER